jgi:hypothetical protein
VGAAPRQKQRFSFAKKQILGGGKIYFFARSFTHCPPQEAWQAAALDFFIVEPAPAELLPKKILFLRCKES